MARALALIPFTTLLSPIVSPPSRSRGGIGRRVRLRTVWGDPWRFESSREQFRHGARLYPEGTEYDPAFVRPDRPPVRFGKQRFEPRLRFPLAGKRWRA